MLKINYIWTIITIFTLIIEWFILNKILAHTSNTNYNRLNCRIVLGILTLCAILINILNIHPNTRVIISISMASIFCFYIYKESLIKSVVISLLYWMIILGIDAISISLLVTINSKCTIGNLMYLNIYRFQVIILSKSILILICFFYCKIKINIDMSKKDIGYFIIPILTNIVSFLVIYKYIIEIKNIYVLNNKEILIISFLLLASNICLILSIRKAIIDNKLIGEGNLIKEKMNIQYLHYLNIQSDNMKIRQLHHDIKNHISCIKGIALNSVEAIKYIDNIESELHKYNNNFNSGNMILDIILNEKNKICNNKCINTMIDVNNFDKCDFVDTIDVCSIFSNILDNAIEACDKIDMPFKNISLRGTVVDDFFVILIENTKQNKIELIDNNIKTNKKDVYLHGLGIKSVKDSIYKYNGEIDIKYSEKKFIVKIFIPLVPV